MSLDWYKNLYFHIGIWPLHVIFLFGFGTIYELVPIDIFYMAYLWSGYITSYKHGFGNIGLAHTDLF